MTITASFAKNEIGAVILERSKGSQGGGACHPALRFFVVPISSGLLQNDRAGIFMGMTECYFRGREK